MRCLVFGKSEKVSFECYVVQGCAAACAMIHFCAELSVNVLIKRATVVH